MPEQLTSILVKDQEKKFPAKPVSGYGKGAMLSVSIRYDDRYGNGHNTFAITGDIRVPGQIVSGVCLHEGIAATFPELAYLIQWHLCSSDGPMHYVANTVYLAGDRDHNGLRKGETRQRRGQESKLMWKLEPMRGKPETYVASDTVPPVVKFHYVPWNEVGEGKERQLDAARSCAVWPEATDEQLSLPATELEKLLKDRLPGLMAEFRKDMEAIGFIF